MTTAKPSASARSSAPEFTPTKTGRETPEKPASKRGWVNPYYRYYKGKKLGQPLSCSPTVDLPPEPTHGCGGGDERNRHNLLSPSHSANREGV